MNRDQKAIIDAAKKNGELPMEYSPRLVVHDMVETMRNVMSDYEVGYKKMTQAQQDACLQRLQKSSEEIADLVVRTIASQGAQSVLMKLKDLKVSNGQLTGVVGADSPNFNELISKVQDKSDVLIVLYPREFNDAMDDIQSEKDQRSLSLDSSEPSKPASKPAKERTSAATGSATSAAALAKKATELPAKLLEDARTFIRDQQVCTVSGIQNGLKIGMVKAVAVLDQMIVEGLCEFVGDSKSGEYKLLHGSAPAVKGADAKAEGAESTGSASTGLTFDGDDDQPDLTDPGDQQPVIQTLTDELFEQIKAQVIKSKKVSAGALSIKFALDDEVVEQAIERLELEGVITEENEMGVRSIVKAK